MFFRVDSSSSIVRISCKRSALTFSRLRILQKEMRFVIPVSEWCVLEENNGSSPVLMHLYTGCGNVLLHHIQWLFGKEAHSPRVILQGYRGSGLHIYKFKLDSKVWVQNEMWIDVQYWTFCEQVGLKVRLEAVQVTFNFLCKSELSWWQADPRFWVPSRSCKLRSSVSTLSSQQLDTMMKRYSVPPCHVPGGRQSHTPPFFKGSLERISWFMHPKC